MNRLQHMSLMILLISAIGALMSCKPYVIEYRKKPRYSDQMKSSSFKDGVTSDGVEVRWLEAERATGNGFDQKIGGDTFRIREEREDGEIILRAKTPHHVLVNTLACLRNAEYKLLWDQMVAVQTRRYYGELEDGYEQYEAFLQKNRTKMAALLNRMVAGRTFGDLIRTTLDDGTIQCTLRRSLQRQFKFHEVLIVPEGRELKLLTIR